MKKLLFGLLLGSGIVFASLVLAETIIPKDAVDSSGNPIVPAPVLTSEQQIQILTSELHKKNVLLSEYAKLADTCNLNDRIILTKIRELLK